METKIIIITVYVCSKSLNYCTQTINECFQPLMSRIKMDASWKRFGPTFPSFIVVLVKIKKNANYSLLSLRGFTSFSSFSWCDKRFCVRLIINFCQHFAKFFFAKSPNSSWHIPFDLLSQQNKLKGKAVKLHFILNNYFNLYETLLYFFVFNNHLWTILLMKICNKKVVESVVLLVSLFL